MPLLCLEQINLCSIIHAAFNLKWQHWFTFMQHYRNNGGTCPYAASPGPGSPQLPRMSTASTAPSLSPAGGETEAYRAFILQLQFTTVHKASSNTLCNCSSQGRFQLYLWKDRSLQLKPELCPIYGTMTVQRQSKASFSSAYGETIQAKALALARVMIWLHSTATPLALPMGS